MPEYSNIFDSHAHYDAPKFDGDRHALLSALPEQGVRAVMSAADTLESAERAIELSERYPFVFASAGIHPHEAKDAPPDLEQRMEALVKRSPKVRALGEMGLDYHYDFSPREVQQSVFERQLALAKELDMPVIIHDREAHADTFALLKKYRPRGIVHCYTGYAEMARELLKLGFYIGFTGAVTFSNARKILEAAAAVPPDRLLVETDCPYMAPVPHRGKRCDSSMIPLTAAVLAGLHGLSTQALLDQTFQNACDIYNVNRMQL